MPRCPHLSDITLRRMLSPASRLPRSVGIEVDDVGLKLCEGSARQGELAGVRLLRVNGSKVADEVGSVAHGVARVDPSTKLTPITWEIPGPEILPTSSFQAP